MLLYLKRELAKYSRILLKAELSLIRRLSCVADMFRHYLEASWRNATASFSEATDTSDGPMVLQFKPNETGV